MLGHRIHGKSEIILFNLALFSKCCRLDSCCLPTFHSPSFFSTRPSERFAKHPNYRRTSHSFPNSPHVTFSGLFKHSKTTLLDWLRKLSVSVTKLFCGIAKAGFRGEHLVLEAQFLPKPGPSFDFACSSLIFSCSLAIIIQEYDLPCVSVPLHNMLLPTHGRFSCASWGNMHSQPAAGCSTGQSCLPRVSREYRRWGRSRDQN